MKLTVCLIVKNEEAVLDDCLRSVQFADEIIVVDTGSNDKTIDIARTYTDKIFTDYKWNDDFAEARNYAFSKATNEWILSIDADEVLQTPISKIKEYLEYMEGYNALRVTMKWDNNYFHNVPRIFKSGLRWNGKIHEYVTCNAKPSDIEIIYKKSLTHFSDPDRNLRILTKSVNDDPTDARAMFYLAREYWDRQDYDNCLRWCEEYLKIGTWRYEKSDAYLTCARCLFMSQRGDDARNYCLQSIMLNPNFKEALSFMAELSWEKEAIVWRKFAKIANNNDVVFIRK